MRTAALEDMIDVWIVDDNEGFRKTVARALAQSPEIRCSQIFGSCESALDFISRDSHPQVILLDIHLPGMTGVDGVRKFKKAAPETQIIMVTSFDDESLVFEAICAGASGYLLKTDRLEIFYQSVLEVVNGGAPMSPSIARSVLSLFTKYAPAKADYGLTAREKEILQLLVNGQTKKEIAGNTNLSYFTVDNHVRNIYQKLQVHSLSAAVAKALRERLF